MMIASLYYYFVLFILLMTPSSTFAVSVDMGKIVMQLKSSSDQDIAALSADILSVTSHYMNEYYHAYYTKTDKEDYFSNALLTVNPYGVQGVAGSYTTTMEFQGLLTFKVDPAPSNSFIETLTLNAFEGENLDFFIEDVTASDSPFLSNLMHIIIEIRDDSVIQKNLEEKDTTDTGATDTANQKSDEVSKEVEEEDELRGWTAIVVYCMAVLLGIVLAFGMYFLLRCCLSPEKLRVMDYGEEPEPINVKDINVPTTVNGQIQRQQDQQRKFRNERPSATTAAAATTTTTTTTTSSATLSKTPKKSNQSFLSYRKGYSPAGQSIASQDSSKFTYTGYAGMSMISYNPAGMSMMSNASLILGNGNCIMSPESDHEPRRYNNNNNNNTAPSPPVAPVPSTGSTASFVNDDISAIDFKDRTLTDLSLIEEGNEELYKDLGPLPSNKENNSDYYYPSLEVRTSSFRQPRKSYGRSVRQDRAQHHSSALARYHARRSSSRSSSSWQQNQQKNISPRYESDYTTEGSSSPESNYSNNSGDVLDDLRNLSLQIDMHRRESTRSGRRY